MTDASTTPSPAPTAKKSNKKWWIIGGVAAALLVIAGVAIWYFVFRDDAPPAVNIEKASESVESTPKSSGDSSSLSGTWKIDTSVGTFDDFSSAFVGYRVKEELAGIGAKTATGRTPDVSGTMEIDGTAATSVDIEVDMTTLVSDESFRDDSIRNQSIETNEFPTASFTLTEPIDFGTIPEEGTTVSVNATGKLTLHGVTKDVTIPLEAKLVNDTIVVTGLFDINFTDYGIEKPQSVRVLSVEDQGQMEMQLFFSK